MMWITTLQASDHTILVLPRYLNSMVSGWRTRWKLMARPSNTDIIVKTTTTRLHGQALMALLSREHQIMVQEVK